jgi:hypothetical protein
MTPRNSLWRRERAWLSGMSLLGFVFLLGVLQRFTGFPGVLLEWCMALTLALVVVLWFNDVRRFHRDLGVVWKAAGAAPSQPPRVTRRSDVLCQHGGVHHWQYEAVGGWVEYAPAQCWKHAEEVTDGVASSTKS